MRTVSVRSLFFVLAITTTSATLPAQNAFLPVNVGSQGCPVDFSVERNYLGPQGAIRVAGRSNAVEPKRSITFSLRSEPGKAITAADITLYAPRISNNATPATVIFGQTADSDLIAKTYHVVQGRFTTGLLTGDLELLDSMAGVERAEIKSVTYADGSAWRPVHGDACVATPRNFTEVAQR
jgi:hypothetical protein